MTISILIFRSVVISIIISLLSFFVAHWGDEIIDDSFTIYCQSEGKEDPACTDYVDNVDEAREFNYLRIMIYLFQIGEIFLVVFVGCLLLGVWYKKYPVRS